MKGSIVMDQELCKGCGNCVEACSMRVIAMTRQLNKMGYFTARPVETRKCSGCAVCANICPEIAITVFQDV